MHNIPHTEEAKLKMSKARRGKPLLKKRRKTKIVDGIEMLQCSTCRKYLSRENFHKNRNTAFGVHTNCKKCHSELCRQYRNKDLDTYRRKMRERYKHTMLTNPEKIRAYLRKQPYKHGPKATARNLLGAAVRRGKIIRPKKCSRCGEMKKITAHHPDYSKPLCVMWLCYMCHFAVERGE